MSFWSRITYVFRGDRLSNEIDEEFAAHMEEAIAAGEEQRIPELMSDRWLSEVTLYGSPAQVRARTRTLQTNGYRVLAFEWHPAEMHIAEPCNSVGAPVLVRVWENIRIDKDAPVLAAADVAHFSVSVSQAKNSFTRLSAGAEQFEFKYCLEFAVLGWGR